MVGRNGGGPIQRAGAGTAPDGENAFDACFARARYDLSAVLFEPGAVEMRVGIDVQAGPYFSFAPTGTSSRNPASTGLPSSPTDAATHIPSHPIPPRFPACSL